MAAPPPPRQVFLVRRRKSRNGGRLDLEVRLLHDLEPDEALAHEDLGAELERVRDAGLERLAVELDLVLLARGDDLHDAARQLDDGVARSDADPRELDRVGL